MKQLCALLFLFVCAPALGQSWSWVKLVERSNNIYLKDVTTDSAGNVYTTGSIIGTGNFPCVSISGSGDMVFTKYDKTGQVTWAMRAEGDFSSGESIKTNEAGDAYVMGGFSGKLTIGQVAKEALTESIFLTKLNKEGQVNWVKSIQGNDYGDVKGIELDVDRTGNVFVLGHFITSVNVGDSLLSSHSTPGHGFFIVAYNPSGEIMWVKGFSKDITPSSLSVDGDGNCIVTGTYKGTVTIGTENLTSKGETDIFIAKHDIEGNPVWVKTVNNTGWSKSNKIEIDNAGNFYLLGNVRLSAEFGNTTFYGDGFFAKYSGDGNVMWVKNTYGSGSIDLLEIASGTNDESYILGNFYGTMTFGDFDLLSLNNTSMVVAKYSASGHVSWVEQVSSKRDVLSRGFSVDSKGNVYVVGKQSDTSFFQNITFPVHEKGSWDHFIGKLAPAGASEVGAPEVAVSYCSGSSGSVSFSTSGSFTAGNTFTVQLSDASGCFTSPLEIGSGVASPIVVNLPDNLSGTGFRMRVVASAPYAAGPESAADVVLYPPPAVSLQALGPVCSNTTEYVLTGGYPAGGAYAGPGVNNGIFNAATAGAGTHEITYTYTNYNGCRSTAVQQVEVTTCMGIRDREVERITQLYPNPTTGKLTLTVPLRVASDVLVRVVNMRGQAVLEKKYGKQQGEFTAALNLSAAGKGLYLLQVILNEQLLVKQVVLQ